MADHAVHREATCTCGQLRFTCEGEPALVSMCHCLECQRRTGSLFGIQAWFPSDRVSGPIGKQQRYVRQADSGRTVTFSFCPACGGTVSWQAEARPGLTALAVGSFANPLFPKADVSIWEQRRHHWTEVLREQIDDRTG